MKTRREKMADRAYRRAYAESILDATISTQIRVLREQRKLSQQQLGELVEMKQSRISALESADYSSWSITTLKRLAEAFDLRLRVSFETFGSLLSESNAMGRSALERASFNEDQAFSNSAAAYAFLDSTRIDAFNLGQPDIWTKDVGLGSYFIYSVKTQPTAKPAKAIQKPLPFVPVAASSHIFFPSGVSTYGEEIIGTTGSYQTRQGIRERVQPHATRHKRAELREHLHQ